MRRRNNHSLMSATVVRSLRVKIALGVALPILLVMLSLSLIHYFRARHLLEAQIEKTAQQVGALALGSVRHALELNDPGLLRATLVDLNRVESIRQVQIVNLDHLIAFDSLNREPGGTADVDAPGCVECHRGSSVARQSTTRLSNLSGVLRIAYPIVNEAPCTTCHTQRTTHLGVLLVDIAVADSEQHLLNDLRVDLLFTIGSTVLFTLGIYALIHRLVVRRIAAMRQPLAEFSAGNFSRRLPASLGPADEIELLTEAVNHMADELKRSAREQHERGEVRQRAIIEERERIARELHDGMAQLLGYVNTKAMAVRMMLKNQRADAADRHLLQLEEASRALFVDVREAILGLKMSGQNGGGLPGALREYTSQFSRLSSLPVELKIDPQAENLSLPAETELQLMRIVQESLTNVRKHASASQAAVSLHLDDYALELKVRDDGVGFEPGRAQLGARSETGPSWGLNTMRERAEAIGAAFRLESDPGAGACIIVRLKLERN